MEHNETGRYWNQNAEAWTILSRQGYDVYRDRLNTPAFLSMLPYVTGRQGLDIGCGEGHNTCLLAQRGAHMTGVDIAPVFLRYAQAARREEPLDVRYLNGSAVELPFPCDSFDFATAFMSLMDIPETERVIGEAYRVLKPDGFLQFSITHPCYDTPHRKQLKDADGRVYAVEIGDYFRNLEGDLSEWTFSAAPPEARAGLPPFRIPRFTRTLSQWLNLLVDTGFVIEQIEEPRPDDETVRAAPNLQDAQVFAYFLLVRVRKPGMNEL